MGRVRVVAMRRVDRSVVLACVGALGLGCASHPDEGTVVEVAPGISGVPGGDEGVIAKQALPISGGTLAISDAGMAVASDPDRDRVFLVELATRRVTPIETPHRAEPGRVVIDPSGRAHVALRATGEVWSIDLSRREVFATRSVCPAPRGLAYDSRLDALQVACDTGELVTLPASGGSSTRSLFLGRDLRDVVVDGDAILVSKFRSAEVLTLDAEGQVVHTARPAMSSPSSAGATLPGFEASVAWRMVAAGDGRVVVAHQRANPGQISIGPG
ncbi:MAG TPA: cytochrome-c peroxidase, partial [Polyangiaceae bacterium]